MRSLVSTVYLVSMFACLATARTAEFESAVSPIQDQDLLVQTDHSDGGDTVAYVKTRFSEALALQQQGKQDQAQQLYLELIDRYPSLLEPYLNSAALYAASDDVAAAQSTLLAGLQANQSVKQLYQGLQQLYAHQAAQAYSQALLDAPGEHSNIPKLANSTLIDTSSLNADLMDQLRATSMRMSTSHQQEIANLKRLFALERSKLSDDLQKAEIASSEESLRASTLQTKLSESTAEVEALRAAVASQDLQIARLEQQLVDAGQAALAAQQSTETVPVSQVEEVANLPRVDEIAKQIVNSWAAAWSSQDVAAYVAHYAADYQGNLPSRQAWLEQRRVRLTNKRFIKVELSWLRVTDLGETIAVEFNQRYQSDSIDDTIRKKLTLAKSSDNLAASKIIMEDVIN